ncbi:hypothetical protein SYNPS1DRAFT_26308 [Syncephalis pseudoplumigaleata]|uniref:SNRNP25 ubiquitin-like domain-containing protein n=1 Tax=Syncephalis pseudoplumigaleata TaxID=1712513 RepID=A0A4P9Z624_9FUNG|nr:hypothetical protein SYNPS1DRAFT_26308 [Syncephalis pseudoplumigaleata]|eukprot:RKP28097.1 hypothetical protein SYNPS1DRAFT_26308 [Syncephalis pseudoplumigaleata]
MASRDVALEQKVEMLEQQLTTLRSDPLLNDVSPHLSTLEIEQLIAYEQGHALRLVLDRGTRQPSIDIVVGHNATVAVLKRLVQAAVNEQIRRDTTLTHGRSRKANWTYTWKRYCLAVHTQRLLDPHQRIHELGLHTGDRLRFIRYTPPKPEKPPVDAMAGARGRGRRRGRGRGHARPPAMSA